MEKVAPNVFVYRYSCSDPYNCQPFRYDANPGRYKLECWGAQGGNLTSPKAIEGGKGGYASGILTITERTTLYIFPGEKGFPGEDGKYTRTTYGQGGQGFGQHSNYYQTSGGGMSFIAVNSPTNSTGIIFAAGGGGSGYGYGYNHKLVSGGFGGGLEGQAGEFAYSSSQAFGGTQTHGGTTKDQPAASGGQYFGGSAKDGGWASGGGGGYFGGAAGSSSGAAGAGGSSFVNNKALSEPKNIAGNLPMPSQYSLDAETTGNSGHGAVRITILGYALTLKTRLQDSYDTFTNITLDFMLPSLGVNEYAAVNRKFRGETTTIVEREDYGQEYNFTDRFLLPRKPGRYEVVYSVSNKAGTTTKLVLPLFINRSPQIHTLGMLKTKFYPGDESYIDINVFDDYSVYLVIKDEEQVYSNITIASMYKLIRTKLNFTVPNYEIGTKHNVSIFATDSLGVNSNIISYEYEVVSNRSPDIYLHKNISYYSYPGTIFNIYASIRDLDPNSRACLVTSIDSSIISYHQCHSFTNASWNDFNGRVGMSNIYYGPHVLSIYAVDQYESESNQIIHYFTYLSPEAYKARCTSNCFYTNTNLMFVFVWACLD